MCFHVHKLLWAPQENISTGIFQLHKQFNAIANCKQLIPYHVQQR